MSEPEVGDTDDWEAGSTGSAEFDLGAHAHDEPIFEDFAASGSASEPAQAAWRYHLWNNDLDGWDLNNSQHVGSQKLRKQVADAGDLIERSKEVLKAMSIQGLDLPTFLYAISASKDSTLSTARGLLIGHPDFQVSFENFDQHSIRGARRRSNSSNKVQKAAAACVKRHIDQEFNALKPIMKMNAQDVSPEALLSIDMKTMMEDTQRLAPMTWGLMKHAAYTRRQSLRNKYKSPDNVSSCFIQ
jgi:hypothetical protein